MSWKWSTGLRDFVEGKGSFRQGFEDSKLMIYTSPIPTDADDAVTGTYLGTFTKSSGTTTLRRGWGEIVKVLVTSHAAAETFGFTCTGSLDAAVTTATYTNTPDAGAAADVAVRLVRLFTDVGLRACATGQDGYIYVMGHNNQSLTIALAGGMTGTVTITDAQYATDTNDLLRFGAPASAVIAKDTGQTWSGAMSASGTAAYGRIVDVNDLGTDNTTDKRMQGSVGVGTGEIQISNQNVTSGATETCTTCSFTWPSE